MSLNTHWFHVLLIVVAASAIGGCASAPKSAQTMLPAPSGTSAAAVRHNDEGIQAYQQQQWTTAKEHFEAAIKVAADLAEAHYNLGMVLYRLGALSEGDAHFIKAANLAPGDKIIWNSPPLAGVSVPEKRAKCQVTEEAGIVTDEVLARRAEVYRVSRASAPRETRWGASLLSDGYGQLSEACADHQHALKEHAEGCARVTV